MGRRKLTGLIATTALFYVIAVANDRLALYVLAWTLASLLLVAWALARFNGHGVVIERHAVPPRLRAGEPLPLALNLTNLGSVPRTNLVLADRVANLTRGSHAVRSVLVPVLAGESTVRLETELVPARRGRAVLGPVHVVSGDPLGFFETARDLPATQVEVLVHPRLVPLEAVRAAGGRGDDEGQRRRAPSGYELHSIREYQHGDDLRRVHWKASARLGRLIVREYEQPGVREAVVLLDLDERQVHGHGDHGSLETAVTAAASLAERLALLGHQVRLLAHEGGLRESLVAPRARLSGVLLDELALVEGKGTVSAAALLAQQADRLRPGTLVVVVTASTAPELARAVETLCARGRAVWLVLLDPAGFALTAPEPAPPPGGLTADEVRRRLRGAGARVTLLEPTSELSLCLSGGEES